MKKPPSGSALIFVLMIMMVTLTLLPALVTWVQNESRWSVKQQKTTVAFHLAEAGVDRALWKLKSSTTTWAQAIAGTVITGYDFDTTYDDIQGGEYRIKLSSGPDTSQVTVTSEGRDRHRREVRAVKAIYGTETQTGAIMTQGVMTWANALDVHWGPVLAHENITITDAKASGRYWPRKYSRQVVSGQGSDRDINGLTPPNTDNEEWWTDYEVPDFPVVDFTVLRASAAATSTLNIYGCTKTGASWDTNSSCDGGTHTDDFGASYLHSSSQKNYVWYWDNNVEFTGKTVDKGMGLYGTVIVRGNMLITNTTKPAMGFAGTLPTKAWQEYAKVDTSSTAQYPGDAGYQSNNATFTFGTDTWGDYSKGDDTRMGVRGYAYVGGDLTVDGQANFFGALQVAGKVVKNTGTGNPTLVFYDQNAITNLPTVNTIITLVSWEEVSPDSSSWP